MQYSRILHLRKYILRKRATESFEKVSSYKKVLSLNEPHFLIHNLVFTICSLYVHYMFTIFSLYVHCMFTINEFHVIIHSVILVDFIRN